LFVEIYLTREFNFDLRVFFEEVLKNEHQVVINVWIMAHVKSMYRQEMVVVIVDFNDVLKWACQLKVFSITRLSSKDNSLFYSFRKSHWTAE
jgi:hypothetical protein